MKIMVRIAILAAAAGLAVAACHTNGGGYTVGGTVTGLQGSGLVLLNNSGNSVSPMTNGAFGFSTAIDQGGPYSVTIKSQPTNPAQTCAVYNGSGTISTADVTNIIVTCTEPGRYAYVVNQGANSISAYSIDAATGALKEIAGSPFASTGTTAISAVVDPNGSYLYVANNGSNDVSVFAIDNNTGALASAGSNIAAGSGPFAVLVDPADQFLYVARTWGTTRSRCSPSTPARDWRRRSAVRRIPWTTTHLSEDRPRWQLSLCHQLRRRPGGGILHRGRRRPVGRHRRIAVRGGRRSVVHRDRSHRHIRHT